MADSYSYLMSTTQLSTYIAAYCFRIKDIFKLHFLSCLATLYICKSRPCIQNVRYNYMTI
jgi:hypothetical protein